MPSSYFFWVQEVVREQHISDSCSGSGMHGEPGTAAAPGMHGTFFGMNFFAMRLVFRMLLSMPFRMGLGIHFAFRSRMKVFAS